MDGQITAKPLYCSIILECTHRHTCSKNMPTHMCTELAIAQQTEGHADLGIDLGVCLYYLTEP